MEALLLKISEQVKEIALKAGKSYYSINVELNSYCGTQPIEDETVCSVYVDGYSHCTASTFDNAIAKLKNEINLG